MITISAGTKGEILLPKKVREAIGLKSRGEVTVTIRDGFVEIKPKGSGAVERMRARAKKHGSTKLKMGNALYEEEFTLH
jgi:AbrB family looped-hinge helix DNA binding protein